MDQDDMKLELLALRSDIDRLNKNISTRRGSYLVDEAIIRRAKAYDEVVALMELIDEDPQPWWTMKWVAPGDHVPRKRSTPDQLKQARIRARSKPFTRQRK